MRRLLVVVVMGCLWVGCVSAHMKHFIGKDVRYVAVEDGPPVAVFDLPDGVRAFQYRVGGGTVTLPKTVTTNGQVQMVGTGAYYQEQKLETGGTSITTEGCFITYLAKWDPERQGWIVTSIAYPHQWVC